MPALPTVNAPISRSAMAYVLAGGRGSRLHGADRHARQARRLFRRQVAHHRLRAVQRAQFRHPPHRGRHPVQGAQPDPPPAARLELLPPGAQRELRHPAGQPARLARPPGMPARRTRCSRTSTSSRATPRSTSSCWPATTSTRWITSRCCSSTSSSERRRDGRLHRGAAHGGDRLRRDARRRGGPADLLPGEARRPAGHAGQAGHGARQHGHLRVRDRVSCSTSSAGMPPTRIPAAISARTSSPTRQARHGGRAPLRPLLRAVHRRSRKRTGATWARWMPTGRPIST